MRPNLSVIIPTYNEENRIAATVKDAAAYLGEKSFESTILIVDDGSTDGTVETVRQLQRTIENVRLMAFESNRGKGYVVNRGLCRARGSIRLFMDADNSTRLQEFDRMRSAFEAGHDVVIGSRRRPDSRILSHQPRWRELGGVLFNLLARRINGIDFWDTQVGFKAFRDEVVEPICSRQTVHGWAFDIELLVIARNLSIDVATVPVEWENSSPSRVRWMGMVRALYDLIKIRWKEGNGYYVRSSR